MHYKRKSLLSKVLCLIFVLLSVLSLFACKEQDLNRGSQQVFEGFSVHYLNVGQGDCVFIKFDDGKNMLIDTGDVDNSDSTFKFIKNYLKKYSVNKIDYLVLTHPDQDHVGNAKNLIEEFGVLNAFVPFVSERHLQYYDYFDNALTALNKVGATITISDRYQYIKGQNYSIAFLSPKPKDAVTGSYPDFNGMVIPDEQASNNLSPIIYLQWKDKRFLFTGDAGRSQETLVIDSYKLGLYETIFSRHGITVNLALIDYLKVGHHGADTSSSQYFLNVIQPKNAIISVGGNNFYGHPSTETLLRLLESNTSVNIYRTDYHGTVVVHQTDSSNLEVAIDFEN